MMPMRPFGGQAVAKPAEPAGEPPDEGELRVRYPGWQVDVWLGLREGYVATGGDRFSALELKRLWFMRWLFSDQRSAISDQLVEGGSADS